MRALKIQTKTLFNIKKIVNYLNFVFFYIQVEIKPNCKFLNRFFNLSKTRNDALGTPIINISNDLYVSDLLKMH